jgi:hypothetical protein
MAVNRLGVDDLFTFDGYVKGATSRLFDQSLSQARQDRNRVYREALLLIMSGMVDENPFEITEGIDLVAEVFTSRKPFVPVAETSDDE